MLHTINVTQECIDEGIKSSCHSCPIALAIYPIVGGKLMVGSRYLEDEKSCLPLPPAAIDFIRRFDAGEPVQPFTFEMEL